MRDANAVQDLSRCAHKLTHHACHAPFSSPCTSPCRAKAVIFALCLASAEGSQCLVSLPFARTLLASSSSRVQSRFRPVKSTLRTCECVKAHTHTEAPVALPDRAISIAVIRLSTGGCSPRNCEQRAASVGDASNARTQFERVLLDASRTYNCELASTRRARRSRKPNWTLA